MQSTAQVVMEKKILLDGVLNIDKPAGLTSHDVVDHVRKAVRNRTIRVGHTGTLDPMATGVLPVCVGKATKIAQFLVAQDKEYRVDMKLGLRTDTQDTTGEVLETLPVPDLSEDAIRTVLKKFEGEQMQMPPMISAKRHKGKRLYELARQGVEIEREPCKIIVHEIQLEAVNLPVVRFRVVSGKGTYIRTLCHDIGEALGTAAAMSGLVRVRCGAFHIDDAIGLDTFAAREDVSSRLQTMSDALSSLPSVIVGLEGRSAAAGGRNLTGGFLRRRVGDFNIGDFVRILTRDGSLIAIGQAQMASTQLDALAGNMNVIKPVKVFIH